MENRVSRIAGVNIPTNKRVIIALTYIHGIGPRAAKDIASKLDVLIATDQAAAANAATTKTA